MKRRMTAAIVAVLLAVIGAAILVSYVNGANRRAAAGTVAAPVLVATARIAQGTAVADLKRLVVSKQIPAIAVAAGAVSNLDQLTGLVNSAEIEPGEQLLTSRFADPNNVPAPGEVRIPPGLQQVAILLDSQRVLGGNIVAGATVGVFISFTQPKATHLGVDHVLVTRVQGGVVPPVKKPARGAVSSAAPLPDGGVMVTLAVTPANAQTLVYGAEHGTIWLSLEAPHAK